MIKKTNKCPLFKSMFNNGTHFHTQIQGEERRSIKELKTKVLVTYLNY